MNGNFDTWQFIGGIGLFLFAMAQLELALKSFAGPSLRGVLQNYTDKPVKSVAIGAVTTALVQSSSLVSLMVLAFVGASIMSLQNALGVVFGANLGTTLTGWAIATLGFKLDLDVAALPLIGVGSLTLLGLRGRVSEFGRLSVALGFLLMGLSLMKDSVATLAGSFDLDLLAHLVGWQYLLFGVGFAALVQSSSATMMVTLAALHSGVIPLPAAAAIAIGADLGTTSTVVIGALHGAAGKKRVALAHFIFNATTTVVAFSLLSPLLKLIHFLGVSDPLFSLVAFHSLFNLLGIVLLLPILKPFARFLQRRFSVPVQQESIYVNETTPAVSAAAIVAICEETAHIVGRIICQNMRLFSPPLPTPAGMLPVATVIEDDATKLPFNELYRKNKRLEGEILSFALKLQSEPLEPQQSERLSRLLSAIRHAVNSAKSLRDIRHNLLEFSDSPRTEVSAYLDHFRSTMTEFYNELFRLRTDDESQPVFEDFTNLMARVHGWHDQLHHQIYSDIKRGHLADSEISSLLNVNRELLNSNVALIVALQEYDLREEESAVLNRML